MKHNRCLALLLAFVLALPMTGLAGGLYTLADIQEQAARGWRETYAVKGREIAVDLIPILPQVSQLPVLETIPMPPIAEALFRREVPHWKNPGDGRNSPGSLVVAAPTETLSCELAKEHDYPLRDLPLAGLDMGQVFAEDSGASLLETDRFFQGKLAALFGSSVQASLDKAWQLDRPRPYDQGTDAFTSDIPQPGTTGSFRLVYHQLLRGIPVLYPLQSRIWYAAADNYTSLAFELRQETGVSHPDISLCSFDQITSALAALINENKLQDIEHLALGYVVFGSPQEPGIAMPYWVAEGVRISQVRGKEHRLPLTVIIHPQTADARILEDEKSPQPVREIPKVLP